MPFFSERVANASALPEARKTCESRWDGSNKETYSKSIFEKHFLKYCNKGSTVPIYLSHLLAMTISYTTLFPTFH